MNLKKYVFPVLVCLLLFVFVNSVFAIDPTPTPCVTVAPGGAVSNCIMVDQSKLGFRIPTFTDVLTFAIRGVFVMGGLAALFYLLLGAFSWITSGGDKDKIQAAQAKMQSAVLGVIMIAVVLAIVVTLEQVVFAGKICLGLSCPLTIPQLLKPAGPYPSNTIAPVTQEILTPSEPTATPEGTIIASPSPIVLTATPTPTPEEIIVTPIDSPTPTYNSTSSGALQ